MIYLSYIYIYYMIKMANWKYCKNGVGDGFLPEPIPPPGRPCVGWCVCVCVSVSVSVCVCVCSTPTPKAVIASTSGAHAVAPTRTDTCLSTTRVLMRCSHIDKNNPIYIYIYIYIYTYIYI